MSECELGAEPGHYSSNYRELCEEAHGKIPKGSVVHHVCGEPACINLEHLEVLTASEHARTHASQRWLEWKPRERWSDKKKEAITRLYEKMKGRPAVDLAAEIRVDASLLSRALNYGQVSMHIKARCLELWGWPIDDWEKR